MTLNHLAEEPIPSAPAEPSSPGAAESATIEHLKDLEDQELHEGKLLGLGLGAEDAQKQIDM